MQTEIMMKQDKSSTLLKTVYWISTGIIALFELSGAFFINSDMAIAGMHYLGLPDWFRWEVSIGHILGGILLIIPIPARIREWVYVAFVIDFISAFIAYMSIEGWGMGALSPLIFLVLLVISYVSYHKLKNIKSVTAVRSEHEKALIL